MDCNEVVYSEDYYDIIIQEENLDIIENPQQYCSQKINDEYTIFYLNRSDVPPLSVVVYGYNAIPKCYTLLDQSALEESGIIRVQNQKNLELKGRGILIGFLDTGIAYENSSFRHSDGSSRIVAMWDQTERFGEPPEGFIYGREYTKEEIDYALNQENPREYVMETDEIGHGTMLASIAAGSEDIENDFIGVAPYADIAVVKLKPAKQNLRNFYYIREGAYAYQENDILAALDYLRNLAEERKEPLVICFGLGTNQGGHAGDGRLETYLDDLAFIPRHAVCVAVGNEANARHHFYGMVREETSQKAEINVTESMNGFMAELWTRAPEIVAVSIISPTGQVLPKVPVWMGQHQRHLFVLENTTVIIDYQIGALRSRSELIHIEFQRPSAGLWTIEVFSNRFYGGTYNIYLPMSEFLEKDVFFLQPNPETTLTSPSAAAIPMSVGGYDVTTDGYFVDSGRGYALSGAIKPDFVAPAVNIYGQGRFGNYDVMTGTSAAVAITSGAAALLMEWNLSYINNRQVNSLDLKNQFIAGAVTVSNRLYPNREEGYGRMNIYETLVNIR